DVVVEHDAALGAVARQTRHQVAAAGSGLRDLARDAFPTQHALQEAGSRRLVAGWIGGVEGQVLTAELDRLASERAPVHDARACSQKRPGLGRLARRRSSSPTARGSPARRAPASRVSWKTSRWARLPPTSTMRASTGSMRATAVA